MMKLINLSRNTLPAQPQCFDLSKLRNTSLKPRSSQHSNPCLVGRPGGLEVAAVVG